MHDYGDRMKLRNEHEINANELQNLIYWQIMKSFDNLRADDRMKLDTSHYNNV